MGQAVTEETNPGLVQNADSNPARSTHSRIAGIEASAGVLERWAAVITLMLTAMLYFLRLGARALWASESRWGPYDQKINLTHNYFWPTINDRVYFDKPLGSYWLVLASTWITGRMDEAATRIPSATAGVLAVALLILLGRRLYDLRTGIASGLILATSFSFAFWGRTASADVETVAGELAALLIFVNHQNKDGWWVVWMWLIMAVTSLTKGLLGFVLPLLVIGSYSCLANGLPELRGSLMFGPLRSRFHWLIERNRWFFNWYTPGALLVASIFYIGPFLISYAVSGSSKGMYMVYRENLERYFAPFDHRGPVYLYAYVIFGLMAPWSIFLPAALFYAHHHNEAANAAPKSQRFVLMFFWTTFIFFTVSGSRRSYYILPILPAAAIMVARLFIRNDGDQDTITRLLLKTGFIVLVSLLFLSGLALLPPHLLLPTPYSSLPPLPRPEIFALCWIVSVGTAVFAWVRYERKQILLSTAVTGYLLLGYLFIFAMPAGDRWRGEKQFAQDVKSLIGGRADELASFKTQPPVFYLRLAHPVRQYDTLAELQAAIRGGRIKWLVVRRRDVPLLSLRVHSTTFEPSNRWDSPEHRANLLVLMRLEP